MRLRLALLALILMPSDWLLSTRKVLQHKNQPASCLTEEHTLKALLKAKSIQHFSLKAKRQSEQQSEQQSERQSETEI